VAQISVDAMSKKQAASTLARLINGSENNFTTIKDSLPFFGFKENVVNYKNDGNYFFARRYYKNGNEAQMHQTLIKNVMDSLLAGIATFRADKFKPNAYYWSTSPMKAKDNKMVYKLEFDLTLNGFFDSSPYIWLFVRRYKLENSSYVEDAMVDKTADKTEPKGEPKKPTDGLMYYSTLAEAEDAVTSIMLVMKEGLKKKKIKSVSTDLYYLNTLNKDRYSIRNPKIEYIADKYTYFAAFTGNDMEWVHFKATYEKDDINSATITKLNLIECSPSSPYKVFIYQINSTNSIKVSMYPMGAKNVPFSGRLTLYCFSKFLTYFMCNG